MTACSSCGLDTIPRDDGRCGFCFPAAAVEDEASATSCVTARARDGCVVNTDRLATAIGVFVNDHNATRRLSIPPAGRGTRARRQVQTVPAYDWLVSETRHHDPSGRGVSRKAIQQILSSTRPPETTELKVADLLVAAIGRPELLHDGTLVIQPNPRASREARAACCGGSVAQAPTATNAVTGNDPVM